LIGNTLFCTGVLVLSEHDYDYQSDVNYASDPDYYNDQEDDLQSESQ
jgi:hypothetical protein